MYEINLMSDAYYSNVNFEIWWNDLQIGQVISCVNIYTWAVELEIYEGHLILEYYISWNKVMSEYFQKLWQCV